MMIVHMCGIIGLFLKDESLQANWEHCLRKCWLPCQIVVLTMASPFMAVMVKLAAARPDHQKRVNEDFADLAGDAAATGMDDNKASLAVKDTHACLRCQQLPMSARRREIRPTVRIMSAGGLMRFTRRSGYHDLLPSDFQYHR